MPGADNGPGNPACLWVGALKQWAELRSRRVPMGRLEVSQQVKRFCGLPVAQHGWFCARAAMGIEARPARVVVKHGIDVQSVQEGPCHRGSSFCPSVVDGNRFGHSVGADVPCEYLRADPDIEAGIEQLFSRSFVPPIDVKPVAAASSTVGAA